MTRQAFRPTVNQSRLEAIEHGVLLAALGLITYDAWVSYQGFIKLGLTGKGPLVFAGLIFITQLGVGALHALGEPFRDIKGASDNKFLNNVWGWVLIVIYGVDIASNTFEFGVTEKLSVAPITPVEGVGGAALIIALAVMLTFGDEVLMRLYDKISVAAKRNRAYAKRYQAVVKAHDKNTQSFEERQMQSAEIQGRKEGDFTFGAGL